MCLVNVLICHVLLQRGNDLQPAGLDGTDNNANEEDPETVRADTVMDEREDVITLGDIVHSQAPCPSAIVQSPYDNERYLDRFCTLSLGERSVVTWGMYQKMRTRKHPVHDGEACVSKAGLTTLIPGKYIEDSVVDMFARILNRKELGKMKESGQTHLFKFCFPVHACVSYKRLTLNK